MLGTAATGSASDAGSGGSGEPVAPLDAGGGGMGAPTVVASLSTPEWIDTDPTFTADLLELYMTSDRAGSLDFWRSTRVSPSDPWGVPELVPELNTASREENAHVSSAGTVIWFTSNREGDENLIWRSTRASRMDAWNPPVVVPELSPGDGAVNVAIAVNADETRFILSAGFFDTGTTPFDLYEFTRDAPGAALSPPLLLDTVNSTTSDDFDPDLRDSGLLLIFETIRTGLGQIYWSRRPDLNTPFPPAVPIPELQSTTYDDAAPAFSDDLRYGMFSSERNGTSDIFEVRIVP